MRELLDTILHIGDKIPELIAQYGPWIYGILGGVIFAETGLVIMPFLPGDSLIFAAGVFTTDKGGLNLFLMGLCLMTAAVLGDNVNYWIGRKLGKRLFSKEKSRIFNKNNLEKTEKFFERYGGKALILARWVAIVRTFAPFVAGMGQMPYRKFLTYSIAGGAIWVWTLIFAGHFLGKIPWVQEHLEIVILIVVFATIPLALFEAYREKKKAAREAAAAVPEA